MKTMILLFSGIIPGFLVFAIYFFCEYRKVITYKDLHKLPKNLILRFTMSNEKSAWNTYQEFQKLRDFIKDLNIPLFEKKSLFYRIEGIEEIYLKKISREMTDKYLEYLEQKDLEQKDTD